MMRRRMLLSLAVLLSLPPAVNGQCSSVAITPASDYAFAVATSDSSGSYRWTLDGRTLGSGRTSQTLLLHADDSLTSTSGVEPLDRANVSFKPGRWDAALAVEQTGMLTYPAITLNLDEGTIEMLIAPRVDGSDPFYRTRDQTLFRYRAPSNGEMAIGISTVGGGFYAGIDPGANFKGVGVQGFWTWKANEWHHIAFSWSVQHLRMRFFLDGKLVSENVGKYTAPSGAGDRFSIGSDLWNRGAFVLLDEIRFSSEEKPPEEIRQSAARTSPIGSNEVWLSLQGLAPGVLQFELTPADATDPCPPAVWNYAGIPLTGALPASNLLPAGTGSVLFSVRSVEPASCGYSVGAAREYGEMTPFEEGQGDAFHRTRIGISPDPKQLNRVFVRCDLAPGYAIEMKYRSVAAANPPFPRKGAIWMGTATMRANFSAASRIGLFFGSNVPLQEIANLRDANPDVLIFPSVSADEASDSSATPAGLPADYFLKDVNGKRIEGSWSLLYKLNLTRPEVADFLADWAYRLNRDADFAFDGIFFDNFHTSMSYQSRSDAFGNPVRIDANGDGVEDDPVWLDAAWRAGVYRLLNRFRSLMPNALLAGHLGTTAAEPEARASFNGDSIVSSATDVAEGRAQLRDLWARYHSWMEGARRPALHLMEGAPHHQIAYGYGIWDASTNIPPETLEFARTFHPLVRFGLALTLMNDGYFVYNFGDVGVLLNDLKTVWWYDEYDFDLGYPTGPALQLDTQVGNNLIRNGGFESPWQQGWQFSNDRSGGTRATVDNASAPGAPGGASTARVSVTSAGKFNDVQFYQPDLPVEKAQTYTVRFFAKADPGRKMNVGVLKNTPDFRNYGLWTTLDLGPGWKEYVIPFEANVTAKDARLCFYFGDTVGDVWLDEVTFRAGGDPVYRRDFTKGAVLLNGAGKRVRVKVGSGFSRFSGAQAPRHQYLVDDGAEGFTTSGDWRVATVDGGFGAGGPKPNGPYYHAWNGSCRISDSGRGVAQWLLSVPEDGEYTVQAWWAAAPDASKWSSRAVFEVVGGGQVRASAALDQRSAGDRWHTIAKLRLSAADSPVVRVRSEGSGALVADALHVFSTERLNDGSAAEEVVIAARDGILLRRTR